MDFEQLVCYSQTLILLVLLVGYLINWQRGIKSSNSKAIVKCSNCGNNFSESEANYCSNCGHMKSHSEGTSLQE